jgi:hypothetical protein
MEYFTPSSILVILAVAVLIVGIYLKLKKKGKR